MENWKDQQKVDDQKPADSLGKVEVNGLRGASAGVPFAVVVSIAMRPPWRTMLR